MIADSISHEAVIVWLRELVALENFKLGQPMGHSPRYLAKYCLHTGELSLHVHSARHSAIMHHDSGTDESPGQQSLWRDKYDGTCLVPPVHNNKLDQTASLTANIS